MVSRLALNQFECQKLTPTVCGYFSFIALAVFLAIVPRVALYEFSEAGYSCLPAPSALAMPGL